MKATCSSETSVDFQRTTWRYVPEDKNLHYHRCENLKSDNQYFSQKKIYLPQNNSAAFMILWKE
jgi:hypothetical protein